MNGMNAHSNGDAEWHREQRDIEVPSGLSREEKRQFILSHAKKSELSDEAFHDAEAMKAIFPECFPDERDAHIAALTAQRDELVVALRFCFTLAVGLAVQSYEDEVPEDIRAFGVAESELMDDSDERSVDDWIRMSMAALAKVKEQQ